MLHTYLDSSSGRIKARRIFKFYMESVMNLVYNMEQAVHYTGDLIIQDTHHDKYVSCLLSIFR